MVKRILKSRQSLVADIWAVACANHISYSEIVSGDVCRSFLSAYFDSGHALCYRVGWTCPDMSRSSIPARQRLQRARAIQLVDMKVVIFPNVHEPYHLVI